MFAKETYVQRRALLKKNIGSGVLLFLGNDEQGLHYEDNTFRYRQDSTFLYYFGLSFAGLSAIIDIDEDKEIIFGDELTIDHIVWMGTQPTLKEKSERVGITDVMPSSEIVNYLHKAVRKGQTVHYLPPYRAEHKLKLMDWLGIPPARQEGSVPFIRAVVAQRNYKSAEEGAEIEKACNVTADALNFLSRLPYPGNIRELKNLVERTILVSGKPVLDATDFDAQYLRHDEPAKAAEGTSFAGMTLDEIERQTILQALEQHKGNLSQVAVSLGISRAALYRRLEKYNIQVPCA